MNANDLDRRITFVGPNLVPLGMGEFKKDGWAPVGPPRWAKYMPVSDAEKLRAAAVEQKTDARFVVRYSAQLAALGGEHRIEFDGDLWGVSGSKELGRRQWLEFTAWRLKRVGG